MTNLLQLRETVARAIDPQAFIVIDLQANGLVPNAASQARYEKALALADTVLAATGIETLLKREEALREALAPFARCSTGREEEVPDDTTVQAKTLYYHLDAAHIARLAEAGMAIPDNRVSLIVSLDGLKIGDFRKARTTLAETQEGE